ncbi:MAG: hypothetical protein FJW40_03345 [Acidobacteria bacterium]|nr:hypothetical protein [Acidobacteriota bacterium]
MFQLFRNRDTAFRYVLGGMLTLIAVSMVVTLIPGFGSGSGASGDDQTVAEVGDSVVTEREVRLQAQNMVRGGGVPAGMAGFIVPQMVESRVAELAVEYQAKRMGFEVTESDVAAYIKELMPALFPNGQFVGQQAYASMLGQRGTTVQEFERNVRRSLVTSKLHSLVAEGLLVTNAEVEAEFRKSNDKITIAFLTLDPAKVREEVKVTEADVAAEFEKTKAGHKVGEQRTFSLLVLDEARVASQFNVPDAELRRAYASDTERFRTPERVRVRHILLKTTDKPAAELPTIRKRMEDLLKQAKGGANFAELAKKVSEDTGSAPNGGDIGFVTRGQTVKAFEEAAFKMKANELSGIVATEYGLHIIQMVERQDAHTLTFEEARPQLVKEATQRQVYDRMPAIAGEMRDALAKAPTATVDVATKYNAQLVKAEKIGSGDAPLPLLNKAPEVYAAVAGLKKGDVTQVINVAGNRLVVAQLDEIHPERPATLADVGGRIMEDLRIARGNQLLEARRKTAEEKLAAAGADLKKVGAELKLEYKEAPEFTADGAAEGLGSASVLTEAFAKPVGSLIKPVTLDGKWFFVKVTGRQDADLSKLPAGREAIVAKLRNAKQTERRQLFEDGLVAKLTAEGKIKIRQDAIKRIVNTI